MNFKNKLLILISFLLLSLALRELPYINFLVAGRLWIFYLFLLFLFLPLGISKLSLLLISLFVLSIILSLLNLGSFAEFLGIAVYLLLWMILVLKIMAFVKDA